MKVWANGYLVDVYQRDCPTRPCYGLGFDKGTFSPGRGYTSYYRDRKGDFIEYPVCRTRHLYGCPVNSYCPTCNRASILAPGEPCEYKPCPGVLQPPTLGDET